MLNNSKKIVFILNTLSVGGIGKVVSTYANELAEEEHLDVFIIVLHKNTKLFNINPKISLIENNHDRKIEGKFYYTIKTFFFIRNIVDEIKPDRIIVNGEWLNSFVYFSLFGKKSKIYLADHCNPLRSRQSPYPFFDQFAYKKCAGILVLSDAAIIKIKKQFGNRNIHLIKNPVTLLEKENIEPSNIIIAVGRLSKEKGLEYLIRAYKLLNNMEWELHLLGDGDDKERLTQITNELNILSKVKFLGSQKNIAKYLSRSKIFVLPSLTENFPMALIEAMSIPLPCIVTDCMPWRGKNDFIQDGFNGLKVPIDDSLSLANALKKLIDSEQLRNNLMKNAYKVRSEFRMGEIIQQYKNALRI
jgi:glycosyltransferase involved in cell wall biosynthesis